MSCTASRSPLLRPMSAPPGPVVVALSRAGVATVLGSLGVLTVLRQIELAKPLIRRVDPLNVWVPLFRFFGPRPGTHDIHVVFRQRTADGDVSAWQEIGLDQQRRLVHTVWAPHRRLGKALSDVARSVLARHRVPHDHAALLGDMSYRAILNAVVFSPVHGPDVEAVQFGVGQSAGYDDDEPPVMQFVSEFHELDAERRRTAGAAGPVPAAST